METLDQKLQKARDKFAKELAKVEREIIFKHGLSEKFPDLKVHCYEGNLYNSTMRVIFPYNAYNYFGSIDKNPTYNNLIAISKHFEPIPLRKVCDGCTSFRPAVYVDSLPESKKEFWDEETDVSPFTIKLSCFQQSIMTFSWFAVHNKRIIHVSVEMQMDDRIAMLSTKWISDNNRRKKKVMHYVPNNNLVYTIYDNDGDSIAGLQPVIMWASNDEKTPNDHTMYWIDHYHNKTATIADLLQPIINEEKE